MGMSEPMLAGQVPDVGAIPRRTPNATPLVRSSDSAYSLHEKDNGLNQRATPPLKSNSSQTTRRKKLPWLEDRQRVKEQSPQVTHPPVPSTSVGHKRRDDHTTPAPAASSHEKTVVGNPASRRASITVLGPDPSLRAIGSAPSLREKPKHAPSDKLSLNSTSRPHLHVLSARRFARRQSAHSDKATTKSEDYTPSEYSSPVSARHGWSNRAQQGSLSQREPRLVHNASVKTPAIHGPSPFMRDWIQAQVQSPFEDPGSPIPERRSRRRSLDGHRSYDSSHLPIEDRKPEPDFAPPDSQPTSSRFQRLRRPTTLYALPGHLMAPSSSSSPSVPSHLKISSDDSSSEKYVRKATLPEPPTLHKHRSERHRTDGDLKDAADRLGLLVDQAIGSVDNATVSGLSDEVIQILRDTSAALQKANKVLSPQSQPAARPLRRTVRGSSRSSRPRGSEHSSEESYDSRREGSAETAPTHFTASGRPSHQQMGERRDHLEEPKMPPDDASGNGSIAQTPLRLYQVPSADSIVRDFAYAKARNAKAQLAQSLSPSASFGAAADFYGDHGESIKTQPGVRKSIAPAAPGGREAPIMRSATNISPGASPVPGTDTGPRGRRLTKSGLRQMDPVAQPPTWHNDRLRTDGQPQLPIHTAKADRHMPHVSEFFENAYYRITKPDDTNDGRKESTVTDTSGPLHAALIPSRENIDLKHPRRKHISLQEGQGFSLGRYHRRQPIAREWHPTRKRITAAIACANTVFIGLIAGIYAGEVPRIQYQIADTSHKVILGNVLLFVGLGLSTLIFWPLPLLHGRKPYTLLAFGLMLPLQFPQALSVINYRDPTNPLYRCGLLIPRVLTGLALGFANINQLPTLFDLFGASLMSEKPHQELVTYDDVRRQGGGVGIWLGLWSWCFIGSLSLGFCIGACIISSMDPSWGFYVVVLLLAFFLLVNVIAPETRRAPYRRSIAHFFDSDDQLRRRVARGEVRLHIYNDGPKWWFQEVWAGMVLVKRMAFQPGFFVLMSYFAWIYAQVTLVILFLGALLSRDYMWQPQYVGLAALSLGVGAMLATPLAKASLFSRSRSTPQRTDSMTMRAPRLVWTSHLLRRCTFTLLLPFAGLAYTLSAPGPSVSWTSPTIFCGLVGFLSNLAVAECVGLIMETFDTCDLQPGVNQKHRLQSMAETTRRRRTNYSSFPRVCAGFFAAQSLGFFLAAAATGVSGDVSRALGAQEATAITAAILLGITILLLIVLFRFRQVQVIPNHVLGVAAGGTKKGSLAWGPSIDDPEWRPVIIGNPSGKMRRVNLLEMGSLTRWSEIRRLNKIVRG